MSTEQICSVWVPFPLVDSIFLPICSLQDLNATVQWLSQQPLVHFVSPVPRATTNNLYAGITSEAGSLSSSMKIDPQDMANTPFWRMGLDGTGQVILALPSHHALHTCPLCKGGHHTSASCPPCHFSTTSCLIRPFAVHHPGSCALLCD